MTLTLLPVVAIFVFLFFLVFVLLGLVHFIVHIIITDSLLSNSYSLLQLTKGGKEEEKIPAIVK